MVGSVGWVWSVLFFLFLWDILLRAQNPGLMADDSGEFTAASCRLGLPHPPGYPILCLLGRLTSFLPLGTPAFRLNLLSQALVLGALWICLKTVRSLLDNGKSETEVGFFLLAMAFVFVGCRSLFAQCLTAKGCVYTLTLFWTCLSVWIYRTGEKGGANPNPYLLFFIWALGMANHWQTHMAWLPFLGFWVFQNRNWWDGRTILRTMSFMILGVSPYLYLPLRGRIEPLPFWGEPTHWPGFQWVLSRRLVAGLEPLSLHLEYYRTFLDQLGMVLGRHWLPGFVLGMIPGVYFLFIQHRRFLAGITALLLGVGTAVALVHEAQNTYLVPLYLISLCGLIWLVGVCGWWGLLGKFRNGRWIILLTALLIVSAWLDHTYQLEDKSRYTLADDFAENVLQEIPKKSLFIAEGDHYVMGIWYELYGRGLRPDLVFEPGVFLLHDWGWRQIARQDEDWKILGDTPLFQERLEILLGQPLRHPFFYSLDNIKLRPALARLPGGWRREGLAYRWVDPKAVRPDGFLRKRLATALSKQRFRGRDPKVDLADPSSGVILDYYRDEYSGKPKE